jgi:hypothetical protein
MCMCDTDVQFITFHMKTTHSNENSIYVFPEKELRGLSPNFHIHVSVRIY